MSDVPHATVYVGVIGPGAGATPADLDSAEQIGAELGRSGVVLLTGGLGGVMAAAARGSARVGGTSLGLLPGRERAAADPALTFAIPTGLGELRNGLLVRAADALICVGLSWGTLSEVALAVRTGVPVVTLGEVALPLEGPLAATGAAQAVRLALTAVGIGASGAMAGSAASARPSPAQVGTPGAPLVHHVTLTVTNTPLSADWYQALLGPAAAVRRDAPGWQRVRLQWPSGLVLVVTTHTETDPDDRFAHLRVGLDHLALGCSSKDEVRAWASRFDELGAQRGPVEDVPYAWTVTGRDPDNIPVEFFAPK